MTDHEIQALGPAFRNFLGGFRECFRHRGVRAHFDNYCRGLLSDLPRKSVEPMALACGTTVRTLQQFLAAVQWDHEQARTLLHHHLREHLAAHPADDLGCVGVIDETSCRKWGDKTPGVQRQYLGCVGKIDSGLVTVHVGVAKGTFQALLDADLYLPAAWAEDRDRCREAGIPDAVGYRPKWRIALDQLVRLCDNGLSFDWLTFDEGYGSKVPFLSILTLVGQKFVAEVPVNFAVRTRGALDSRRADAVLTTKDAERGERFVLARKTTADAVWRAASRLVHVGDHAYRLVVATHEATGEVKYFATNATEEPLERVLRVAFRRATIEHGFRLAKQEAGLMHFEGRQYVGLIRHLILATIVMGFVAVHTERLRGKKSGGDAGASVPGVEPSLRDDLPPPSRQTGVGAHGRSNPVSPAA